MKITNKKDDFARISFKIKLSKIYNYTVLKIPKEESEKLSSRGLVMIKGTINGAPFQTALEPDGLGSHWFEVDKIMQKDLKVKAGDSVSIKAVQVTDWPEPKLPSELKEALSKSSKSNAQWKDITAMARWEWIRWIRGTKNEDTRLKRISVTISKLNAGHRRPCCFNARECTVPYLSNKGILLSE